MHSVGDHAVEVEVGVNKAYCLHWALGKQCPSTKKKPLKQVVHYKAFEHIESVQPIEGLFLNIFKLQLEHGEGHKLQVIVITCA